MPVDVSKLEAWWGDAPDEAEWAAEANGIKQFVAEIASEIAPLPKARQDHWNRTPVHLLDERSPYRALLRREAQLARRRLPASCRGPRRARGTTRMRRARRVARTCGSRGDPPPEPDLAAPSPPCGLVWLER